MKQKNKKKLLLKEMPKPARKATAQGLAKIGFTKVMIAEKMGIDWKTVDRYVNEELGDEWENFSNAIKNVYAEQDFELVQLAINQIKQKIGKARFYELTGLLKTVRDFQKQPSIANIQQQQNVQVNVSKQEDKEDGKPADSVERITSELEDLQRELDGDSEEGEVVEGTGKEDIQEIS